MKSVFEQLHILYALQDKITKKQVVKYIYNEKDVLSKIANYLDESPDYHGCTLSDAMRCYFDTRPKLHLIHLIIESSKPKNEQRKYIELFNYQ